MPVVKLPSEQIEMGMYVASLDRPWSETPFLFQGFEVHEGYELDELKRLTNHVYIMVPDEQIEITPLASDHSHKLESPDVKTTVYYDLAPADEEIRRVKETHEEVVNVISEVEALVGSDQRFNLDLIQEPVDLMVDSIVTNPDAFTWLTRIRKFDSFLYKDSLTAAVLGTSLGRQLGISRENLTALAVGCMMMDIGKLSLSAKLLHKEAQLSREEWELMKRHVDMGIDTLEKNDVYHPVIHDVVRSHHERYDGSGYPDGLRGNEIPLYGQIAGIVDQYVSVTSPRPYANVISASMAETMLYNQKNRLFDESLVEYFIKALGTYPTGSLVELSSGEAGAVIAQNPSLHLKPDIVLLLEPDKKPYKIYTTVSMANYHRDGKLVSIVKSLKEGEYGLNTEDISMQ